MEASSDGYRAIISFFISLEMFYDLLGRQCRGQVTHRFKRWPGSTELEIFRVISAFCDTSVSQNAEITRKIPSSGSISASVMGFHLYRRCRGILLSLLGGRLRGVIHHTALIHVSSWEPF